MIIEKIDLYENYDVERNGATGGFLTVYARTGSSEIKKRIRPCVLIIPGGGYNILSDRECEPVALKYLNEGYVSFVLSYSLRTSYPVPLDEAMLAMAYIRENADKYDLDGNRICVAGFSAGGHLAGLLATATDDEAERIEKRAEEVRPNAVIYSYPVISMGEYTHSDTRRNITGENETLYGKLSVENRIDGSTPPAFIWHTSEDDCVPVENSFMLANAYRKAGVPFSLHIFEEGGHGLATCDIETCDVNGCNYLGDNAKWFGLSVDWLKSRGFAVRISE